MGTASRTSPTTQAVRRGDEDEEDPSNLPFCGDGIDNDGDGQADYPNDPGCAGVGDRDETDPMVIPMCSDGVDNDRDGRIDYPEDRGCSSAADSSEGGACGRRYEAVEVEPGRIYRGDSQRGVGLRVAAGAVAHPK